MSGFVKTTFDLSEIEKATFDFGDWKIETSRCHILESKCKSKEQCDNQSEPNNRCLFCQ